MVRDTRALRLKAVWLLVPPFLWFADPTPRSLAWGVAPVVLGLLIRAWAAGSIVKDDRLTTWGPYAYVRHPLYVGSLLIGVGITVAGGHWIWSVAFLLFYLPVYGLTVSAEARLLDDRFGAPYREYRERVPAFVPRRPGPATGMPSGEGFEARRYVAHREWEALLGAAAVLAFLVARASGRI